MPKAILASIALLSLCAGLAHAQPTSTALPFSAEAISADGRVVVGGPGPYMSGDAVYWTRTGGLVHLGIPYGYSYAKAVATNGDGSVIVGVASLAAGALGSWIWTQETGMTPISMSDLLNVQASCISRDGSTVGGAAVDTGQHQYHSFVWTRDGGGRLIPQGSNYATWLHALSPTGLSGVGSGASGVGTWPMLWGSTYVWCVSLGSISGMTGGFAYAMSPDSGTVVGNLYGPNNTGEAFAWTARNGLEPLNPPADYVNADLRAVSDDGLIAGGFASASDASTTAVIWRQGAGLILASSYFAERGIQTGTLTRIVGISANGRVFCDRNTLIDLGTCASADFNHDGDAASDADIEDFFSCLAGNCCPLCDSADFNGDGDSATDADIEAFFRVLAGGAC